MDKPHQRKGAANNAQVGREFELGVQDFLEKKGLQLSSNLAVEIGINGRKLHKFDLADENKKVIVECKSHKWTEGGNVPSAKMTAWNQAMFYFHASPKFYRKIFFVLKDFSQKRNETLGEYYIRTYHHLIPKDVEVWEFDEQMHTAKRIN